MLRALCILVLAAAGCADPEACRINDDCPGGYRCDADDRVCVKEAGGDDGGDGDCVATAEVCDGVDNDCDGDVDEEPDLQARGVIGGACGTPGDPCSEGVVSCIDGGLGCAPTAAPAEEACTGVDDDCDGQVDEGFDLGRHCDEGVGQCRREGVTVCDASGGGTVCGAVPEQPSGEICDNLDNDCDGEVDEELPVGDECVVGKGECTRTGALVCQPGGVMVCDAEPGRPALRDVCNGRDEDCDGGIDEDFDVGAPCWVGEGQCEREGTVLCTANADAACDVNPGLPTEELCNSLDDDCDGATDEEFNLADTCSIGIGRCRTQGIWVCSEDGSEQLCDAEPPVQGQQEHCNGLDDDCDGLTDEDFDIGAPCGVGVGECRRAGTRVCGDGPFTICPAVPGPANALEQCDGLDDDCDAQTDEGFDVGGFCRVGEGACVQVGELRCTLNRRDAECDAEPLPPSPEICNDIDDDCDGNTDEPVASLEFPLEGGPDAEAGTLLRSHADGSFVVASLAGQQLSVAAVDCAWSVAWRVELPNSAAPRALADGEEDGVVVLEGDADRSLVALGEEGPRWRLNLGPAEEIGGVAPYAEGYAVVVRDEVQLLDFEGRQSARWAHEAPLAEDGALTVPAISPGPGGSLLLSWSDPLTGNGVVRRVTAAGEEVALTVVDGGGATLTPQVQAVGRGGATLLTGVLRDDAGVAAWLGIIDAEGVLQVERGSPFYSGCVSGAFAPDVSEPVLRCVVPHRVLFLHPDGDVSRSVNTVTAAMAPDPFGARSVVLLAELDGAGLTFSRLLRPD